MKKPFLALSFLALAIVSTSVYAEDQPKIVNAAEAKFAAFPNTPKCAKGAVQNGDPNQGASVMLLRFTPGCSVPTHWHTPNEQVMMVSGTAKLTPHAGEAKVLRSGAYAFMPSKHPHSFICTTACSFYLTSDGAFDIHYVDASGKEISADEALQTSKKAPKK